MYVADCYQETWIINAIPFFEDTTELANGRDLMNKALERLVRATEFAILDNSENMLDKQIILQDSLAEFQLELRQNKFTQERLAASQTAAIQHLSDDFQKFRDEYKEDIKKLIAYHQTPLSDKNDETGGEQESGSARIRAMFAGTPDVLGPLQEFENAQVEGTCSWVFETQSWAAWKNVELGSPALLYIQGKLGVGKSYIAYSVYKHLKKHQMPGFEVCTAYFPCSTDDIWKWSVENAIVSIIVQITDQSQVLRQFLETKLEQEEILLKMMGGGLEELLEIFLYEVFTSSSKFQLFIVFDDIDDLDIDNQKRILTDMVRKIEEQKLRIKIVSTSTTVNQTHSPDILQLGKRDISQDLRKIVWQRLHSNDSAYDNLKKLHTHTKQKLARRIEQNADSK